jgi:hypothetical protein
LFSILCKRITPTLYPFPLGISPGLPEGVLMRIALPPTLIFLIGFSVIGCAPVPGQTAPSTVLVIDVDNNVEYQQDISDPSKYATNPAVTPPETPRNFYVATIIGDIVAVNGQPAKGTYIGRARSLYANVGTPGAAVSDVTRAAIREQIFEILKSDNTPVGTIVALGDSGGPVPPGAPLAAQKGNWAIVGGTGAFLGARGQEGVGINSARAASMAEDPGNRRTNGGGPARYVLHVIPMEVPQIAMTPNGAAVTHSKDFSLVSTVAPASAGEALSVFLTGLGPTVPGVDPGQPFPASPPANVNSPVEVSVNGQPAEVLGAAGLPGALDGYQVNFRLPAAMAKGSATIQVSAAWMASAPVTIQVQ